MYMQNRLEAKKGFQVNPAAGKLKTHGDIIKLW